MARAQICVKLPDGQWKADVTREFSETTVCLRSSAVAESVTTEVVALPGQLRSERFRAIRAHPDIATFVRQSEREVTLQVEGSDAGLLTAASRAGTPISYPVEIHDGQALVEVIGTHECIKGFGAQLTEAGLSFDVSHLQHEHDQKAECLLTQRQREFVQTAVDLGYYETPRQCSLTEVADEMDVAKSTCCEILHRAEQALVEQFLTEQPSPTHDNRVRDSFGSEAVFTG